MDKSMQNTIYWLAISRLPGIGGVTVRKIGKSFSSPELLFQADDQKLKALGVPQKAHDAIRLGVEREEIGRELDRWKEQGIGVLSFDDALYPEALRQIYDPPAVLYYLGDPGMLAYRRMAIVGARRCSSYGERAAFTLARDLASLGICIVSGMAFGIDARAHQGALSADGRTVAVLGCGVDLCYPPENARLYRRIAEKGLLISENPPGTEPKAGLFPKRNRLISGISEGVIIVEAGEKSGSLITAEEALEQGHDVYAVPGSVFSYVSRGSNRLIQNGEAMLIMEASDIPKVGNITSGLKEQEPDFESEEERMIWRAVEEEGKTTEVLLETGLNSQVLQQTLMRMELKGWIEQTAGHRWIRKGS